ncbi:MAG: hypothetical protein ACT4P6_14150 [Gemmatimonadaceae bacterium]
MPGLTGGSTLRERLALTPNAAALRKTGILAELAPDVRRLRDMVARPPVPPSQPPPQPPVVSPPPPPQVLPTLPRVPDENPFNHLPFPTPGERIRSDDFRQLSLCLQLIQATTQLSAALFGHTLSAARPFLAAQGRVLARTMTVFGTVLDDPNDTSLDDRRIMQVLPVIIGEPEVQVIVSEAVETRRLSPSLLGLRYNAAASALSTSVGQGTVPATPVRAPELMGRTLGESANILATQR